ncbi:MAG: XdhC family protein [Acidobacteriota bacterium]
MSDRRKLVELWHRGDAAVLVTLVRVEGSSYRRAGARLLIAANGDYAGAISGGCLEAEVIRKAAWLARDGAVVQRYSTLFDDTADIPYGLGCGGTVDLLIEPADTPLCSALFAALEASLTGASFCIETQLPGGGYPLLRTIETRHPEGAGRIATAELVSDLNEIFREQLDPPQRLLIFGAGDDALPMTRFAALLGWRVVVIDSRAQWALPERFSEAERVVAATSLDGLALSSNDAVVLMTHSYEQDRAWLTAVLPAHPRYLGLLGARHRSALLVAETAALLGWTVAEACAELFAPIGLDLGGDGAEAIALATIAEIQARCEGKIGYSRRMTAEAVAEQIAQGGSSRYLQTQCAL